MTGLRTKVRARPEPAQASDLEALETLEKGFPVGDRLSRRSWRRLIARGAVLVARQGATIEAAAVVLTRAKNGVGRLYSLMVAPAARGRGLGETLTREAAGMAARTGCDRLRLEVRASNAPAIALYEKLGFVRKTTVAGYYSDGEDAMRMELPLAAGDVQP